MAQAKNRRTKVQGILDTKVWHYNLDMDTANGGSKVHGMGLTRAMK